MSRSRPARSSSSRPRNGVTIGGITPVKGAFTIGPFFASRSEEHTSELQSLPTRPPSDLDEPFQARQIKLVPPAQRRYHRRNNSSQRCFHNRAILRISGGPFNPLSPDT